MDDKKLLISKRTTLKGQLTRFCKFIDSFKDDNSKADQLPSRLSTAENLLNEFNSVHIELLSLDETNKDQYESELSTFEDKFYVYISQAIALNKELCVDQKSESNVLDQSNQNSGNSKHQSCNVKLPSIDLPTFNGNPEKWLQFFDTFTSLIHDDVNLNKIQKFYYLKSCLKDNAEAVISSLEVTNANYDIAWSILRDRFQDDKMIIHSHVRALCDLPVVQKESFYQLRKMVDEVNKNIRVLQTFNEPVKEWSTLLIHLLCSKLDHNTKRQWESENIHKKDLPTIEQFLEFLSQRSRLLETLYANKDNVQYNTSGSNQRSQRPRTQSFFNQEKKGYKCYFCKEPHSIFYCNKFLSMSIKNRNQEIRKLNLCTNCLRSTHTIDKCTSSGCKFCGKNHNSLLHYSNNTQVKNQSYNLSSPFSNTEASNITQSSIQQNSHFNPPTHCQGPKGATTQTDNHTSTQSTPVVLNNNYTQPQEKEVLLATAVVDIFDKFGNVYQARALLDSGSQSNFITTDLCEKLKLRKQSFHLPVSGINETVTKISHLVNTIIQSRTSSYKINLSFLILDKITGNLPTVTVNVNQFVVPTNVHLADENFYSPSKIDLLLGASIFFDLLCIGQIRINNNFPIIQKTKLGWIITGNLPFQTIQKQENLTVCSLAINSLQDQLRQFWEIENIEVKKRYSQEEEECEREFLESVKRNENGQFVVPLLTKSNLTNLGDSYQTALNRFKYLERKLEKDLKLKTYYTDFMEEYKHLGHMAIINETEKLDFNYYLPHHGILKEDSVTTKLRVVFDGSAKTTSNISLNDCLKVGPTIQPDLFTILLRFRNFNVVLAADIEKMYRQVIVKEEHQNLQRILWRTNSSDEIQQFKLTRVTYGTASAPYLAIRCLDEVANQNLTNYSDAARAIKEGFYVDDLLYGTNDVDSARRLRKDLQTILEQAGFILRKWLSNDQRVFTNVDQNNTLVEHFISSKDESKTLGVYWHTKQDVLFYVINIKNTRVTKRSILSTIAQIFDPLGLVGPCIVHAKVILQMLWKINVDWDESLPNDIHTSFIKFTNQLPELNKINIPRQVILPNANSIQLHGFCDASEVAYGACVYISSSYYDNIKHVHLLCAKGRIAPLKALTIPKLELCAASILTDLMDKVKLSLNISFSKFTYWTDSTIVLCWLKGEPRQWKPFVSNRVAHIQNLTKINEWRHVISKENPADLISRGLNPEELANSTLWWKGPWWLSSEEENWPKIKTTRSTEIPELKRPNISAHSSIKQDFEILRRYSSVTKLHHVIAFIFRFKHNILNKTFKTTGPLSVTELADSLNVIIKLVQNEAFNDEINDINKNKSISKNNKLICLNPILENGILRVGGRINNSTAINFSQKHPIILPASHHFTEILIKQQHYKHLHAGAQSLLAAIRSKYWIISGLTTVKRVLKKCIVCFRTKPMSVTQFMGDLPKTRITPSRAFLHTGLDYCGPFIVKANKLRNSKHIKIYVCIFVCFSTKATHLEIVSDLTTECFLNCFKRFISRRGKPVTLYSDNATTFVGANNQLKEMYSFIDQSKDCTKEYLASESIDWKFIPARSPHFGGIWEAAVKSFKFHLKRIIGNHIFLLENFSTLIIQIEACLNSRPLTPLSSDPLDSEAITPGHFLIFSPLTSIPEPDMRHEPINLNAYQHLNQVLQHFWTRWSNEYLSTLQPRTKWRSKPQDLIKEGQLVCCKEDNLPPLHWKLGRICKVFPGSDGRIRVVAIKTNNGEVRRAVSRICILPIDIN